MKKQIKINDTEFVLQKLPVMAAFEMRNSWLGGDGSVNQTKMYELILEHLVISPKVKLEEFDKYGEIADLDTLVGEAIDFQYGKKK